MNTNKTVFSGIQPTGNLHLGNYLGAIKNWIGMQNDYNCIFCIVDMHAITVAQNPKALNDSIYELAAVYLACGIDPKKSIIFPQSAVSGHAELAWILGCNTPLGWLNRMTQFKDKAGDQKDNAMLGLYSYPVLMAADILLYKATHVPVGEDQKQHLELAREIANSFNHNYKSKTFPQPEPLIKGTATRVMSLNDGTRKMSKSEESDYSRINLSDDADTIRKKFMKSKSDSFPEITYDKDVRPDIANLLTIYAALADISVEAATENFKGKRSSDLKTALADIAVAKLSPLTAEFNKLKQDRAHLKNILQQGAERANQIAEKTIKEVKETVGFF